MKAAVHETHVMRERITEQFLGENTTMVLAAAFEKHAFYSLSTDSTYVKPANN